MYLSTFNKHKIISHCLTQLWICCFYLHCIYKHPNANLCMCLYLTFKSIWVYEFFEKIIFIEAFESTVSTVSQSQFFFAPCCLLFGSRSYYSSPIVFLWTKKMKNHFDWNRKNQNHFLCLLSHIGLVKNYSPLPHVHFRSAFCKGRKSNEHALYKIVD